MVPLNNTPIFTPFAVLWEQTDTLVAGGTLDDKLRIEAIAHCTSPENAERVERTLAAAITLGLNAVEAIQTHPASAPDEQQMKSFLMAGAALLKQVKVSRSDATVVATVEGPLASFPMISALAPAVTAARESARRAQSANNMKQLALAFHNYAATHNHFPPAVVLGPDGKTPHSWRIEILPYLEAGGKALYDKYKMNEPWDSEDNKQVLLQMPAVFRFPDDNEKSFHASYFAVTGPQTIFADIKGTSFRQITDGTSNTIMLVEAKKNIPWTKPEDIAADADKPLPKLGGWTVGGFNVAFADGSVRLIPENVDGELLRKLFSKAGGELVQFPQ
jgi:prepilin-type processing-associated H-X9-DG protein